MFAAYLALYKRSAWMLKAMGLAIMATFIGAALLFEARLLVGFVVGI